MSQIITNKVHPMVSLKNIFHYYGNFQSLNDVNFDINSGEVIALLGPSGSGKTTILRSIAGLEKPSSGNIYINNKKVFGDKEFLPPEKRKIGFVFQDYALFPHLTVEQNILFGLHSSESFRANEVMELLDIVNLGKSYPHEISGGQQQRVALARALAPSPNLILLDEPFARLDIRLREKIRDEILHLLKKSGSTAIIVTHEAEEAMFMSDRIVVVNNGKVMQIGRPGDLYNRPKSEFVTEFFGEVNLISGLIEKGQIKTKVGNFLAGDIPDGSTANIIIRHEGIKLIDQPNNKVAKLPIAKVLQTKLLGRFSLVHLQIGDGASKIHIHARVPGLSYLKSDSFIGIEVDTVQSYIFKT